MDFPYTELYKFMDKRIKLSIPMIERILWCGVMAEEERRFRHPKNKSLDDIIKDLTVPGESYDKFKCKIVKKGQENAGET